MSTDGHLEFVVLLVDDEELVRSFGLQLLERLGYTAFAVADGPSAVAFCEAGDPAPHCVLIDFNLPEMDGTATIGAIRQHTPHMPAILCSGYSPEALGIQDEDSIWNEIVTKPFRRETLAGALERIRDHQS